MKYGLILSYIILLSHCATAQYDLYFQNRALRIDYIHAGTATSEWYAVDEMLAEPFWGGSTSNLIDTLYLGNYFFEVYNKANGELIYSRGYGSLFGEWQTTEEAKHTTRSFMETVVMPYPKQPIEVVFKSRNWNGNFDSVFRLAIDPQSYFINPVQREKWPVYALEVNAPTEKAVDIVLLPDGYTAEEMGKFIHDSRAFVDGFFSFEPFATYRNRFNIKAVMAPSKESGATIPADSIWPHTLLSSSFYTFDSERYCMTLDHKKLRDLAANVPYDQIFVLLNTDKYGGGGIYNFYSLSTIGNTLTSKVIVHEFAHGFAGLGDEYYNSEVAYTDFYNINVEPWEPNLTTLVDFSKKWIHLIDANTPIPTPDTKDYNGITGVFEGGGYTAKDLYRPARNCLMNTFNCDSFCPVCTESIIRMIRFCTD